MTTFEEWAKEYFGVCVAVPEACRDAWNAGATSQKEKDAQICEELRVHYGNGDPDGDECAAAIRNQK